ncbi:MAG: Crp/Fnr family transcriptional regulator [Anaerovorax sp.]
METIFENRIKLFEGNDLFYGIEEKDLESMLKCLGATEKNYKKNTLMIRPGSAISSLGILMEGKAQITRDDEEGNTTIISEIEPGDLFAEAYAAAQVAEVPIGVWAVTPCRVLWIPIDKIITTCSSSCAFHQTLIKNMMKVLAKKNVLMNEKMRLLSCKTIRDKLLTYLRDCKTKSGKEYFFIPFSRKELAEFLSVDRSAMSRELGKLRNEGILECHKNVFKFRK